MTILEQSNRKRNKRKFILGASYKSARYGSLSAGGGIRTRRILHKRLKTTTTGATLSSSGIVSARERFPQIEMHRDLMMNNNNMQHDNNNNNRGRLELDMLTVRVIKSEVLNEISDLARPITVLEMARALKSSPRVKKQLQQPQQPKQQQQQQPVGVGACFEFWHNFFPKLRSDRNQAMRNMYLFMAAMGTLEVTSASWSDTFISTWDEAFHVLKTVFDFSQEALRDLERQEQDDASFYHRHREEDNALASADTTAPLVEEGSLLDPMADFKYRRPETEKIDGELRESTRRWMQVMAAKAPPQIHLQDDQELVGNDNQAVKPPPGATAATALVLDAADLALKQRLQQEEEKARQRDAIPAVQEAEARMREEEERLAKEQRQAEAKEHAASLMRPFTPEENAQIQQALNEIGPPDEIIAQVGTDSVQRGSIQRLRPGQWLNDEVIHYFLVMLSKRDEELCNADPNRKRCHFFKSFFMTKLLNEGHSDPSKDGTYEYRNVKRWSKKVPGKDIFKLDKIIFPINQDRMHWVCAVASMQEKKIQFYDSMGADGMQYLESIMQYIKDEHEDKKKCPLPDEDEWELVPCQPGTPQQLNCFDCGVFTCMFADFCSKGDPLVFGQDHITLCRERIALSILKGTAIM